MKLLLVAISISAVLGVFALASRHASRTRLRRFKGRAELTPEEFFQQFYSRAGIPQPVVRDALWQIAAATGIREGSLRPEDSFEEALRPSPGWEFDDGLNLLGRDLAGRAGKVGASIDPETVRTVDDYVRALHRLSLAEGLGAQL